VIINLRHKPHTFNNNCTYIKIMRKYIYKYIFYYMRILYDYIYKIISVDMSYRINVSVLKTRFIKSLLHFIILKLKKKLYAT